MSEFNKIIGYEKEKEELKRICDTLVNKEKYAKLGIVPPKTLLIHGDPGLGKTLMAKCLIKESKQNLFECKKSSSSGDFVNLIKETFNKAIQNQPSIVFLDDMDKFAEDNLNINCNKNEFVTIQTCLEDIKEKDVFVIATANSLRNLPESLLRAGRFGKQLEIKNPTFENSVKIISHYLKNKKVSKEVNPEKIAILMNNDSCALLENTINEAGIYSGYKNKDEISFEDIVDAYLKLSFRALDDDEVTSENITLIKAYHEAGHAVLSIICDKKITLLTIKNLGSLGGCCSLFNHDFRNTTIKEKIDDIFVALGGKASVENKFNMVDLGALRDIEKSFEILRSLIEEYAIAGFHYCYDYDRYGDKQNLTLQEKIHSKVTKILEEKYEMAKTVLNDNKELLQEIVDNLLTKKILFYDDIEAIKNKHKINLDNYKTILSYKNF